MYQIELRHEGLNKYRVIRGRNQYVVEEKALMQRISWNDQWERKKTRLASVALKQEKERTARQLTEAAIGEIKAIQGILAHTLTIDDTIRWDDLKHINNFDERQPHKPRPPDPEDPDFEPKIGLLDRLIPGRKQKRIDAARENADNAYRDYEMQLEKHGKETLAWESRRDSFLAEQRSHNNALETQKELYESGDPGAIEEYCDLVLSRSEYPDYFPKQFETEYVAEPKRLVIEYELPSIEDVPKKREVKYIKTRNEFDEKYFTEKQINDLYDNLCYEICLRSVHEAFEADSIDAISSVAFNGWVQFVSPETGKEVRSCILSIHVSKAEFVEINLAAIKPKACFRGLKGVGSAQLHKMTAVAPIAMISRVDRRFVEDREVLANLAEGINLACIHWEEFEHLVREVFGQEFSSDGGEVRITQSSRDGGIDAVAFDPDPIRGGKIVIQAKRYTNTVGVSAVRDLYGTLLNEGANKGILVTTSTFGSDAYEFVKGKPLSLLDGSNLLHLLERHGHKARIDIREAKKQQKTMRH